MTPGPVEKRPIRYRTTAEIKAPAETSPPSEPSLPTFSIMRRTGRKNMVAWAIPLQAPMKSIQ